MPTKSEKLRHDGMWWFLGPFRLAQRNMSGNEHCLRCSSGLHSLWGRFKGRGSLRG
jgi:hypothetical protein